MDFNGIATSGVLWAYRNAPHESTGEKPSFLLLGMDCRAPSETALFLPSPVEPSTVETYREELMLNLSSARELAAESLQASQAASKKRYDQGVRVRKYQKGDWVLVKFPSEETGRNRKLSQPWHGPYRVISIDEPDITVQKVYRTQPGTIQVHQSRVTPCPEDLPPGYYWYGRKHSCPGRPPRWVEHLMQPPVGTVEPASNQPSSNISPHQIGDMDFHLVPEATSTEEAEAIDDNEQQQFTENNSLNEEDNVSLGSRDEERHPDEPSQDTLEHHEFQGGSEEQTDDVNAHSSLESGSVEVQSQKCKQPAISRPRSRYTLRRRVRPPGAMVRAWGELVLKGGVMLRTEQTDLCSYVSTHAPHHYICSSVILVIIMYDVMYTNN